MEKLFASTDKININKIIEEAKFDLAGLVKREEEKYRNEIVKCAEFISEQGSNFVFLTGPSASGKTTSSIFLEKELTLHGKKTIRISLDNFYKNRDELPFWKDGTRNFESIEGLDLDYFKVCVEKLMANGYAKMPRFDFAKGERSEKTFEVLFDDDTIIIFEGIHALNPKLYNSVSEDNSIKLYVSVHSDYVDDENKKMIKASDIRLARRMIRDNQNRGTTPDFTLTLWNKVCLGEQEYIRPYRTHSDIAINSTHSYEIFIYKKFILDFFEKLENKEKIVKFVGKLETLPSLHSGIIPADSLLREFIKLEG